MRSSDSIPTSFSGRHLLKASALIGILMLVTGLYWMNLEVIIPGDGRVEAKTTCPLYAPRTARLESILVQPGDEVNEGELLVVFSDEALESRILEKEAEIAGLRHEKELISLEIGELNLVAGGLSYQLAKVSAPLLETEDDLLDRIHVIHRELSEIGLVGELELLELEARRLRTQRDKHRELAEIELWDQGWLENQLKQARARKARVAELGDQLEKQVAHLRSEQERLTLYAPFPGVVSDVQSRFPGKWLAAGDPVLTLVRPGDGYQVRMWVEDRNIDLVKAGIPVRLEPRVYTASIEGYVYGEVSRVILDPDLRESRGFEVWVDLHEWPVEPVIGSVVFAEIRLEKQGVLAWLFRRPLREPSASSVRETVLAEEQAHGS